MWKKPKNDVVLAATNITWSKGSPCPLSSYDLCFLRGWGMLPKNPYFRAHFGIPFLMMLYCFRHNDFSWSVIENFGRLEPTTLIFIRFHQRRRPDRFPVPCFSIYGLVVWSSYSYPNNFPSDSNSTCPFLDFASNKTILNFLPPLLPLFPAAECWVN